MRSPNSASAIKKTAQAVGRDDQRLDIAFGAGIDQRGLSGQCSDFGNKLALALFEDGCHMAEAVALANRHMS